MTRSVGRMLALIAAAVWLASSAPAQPPATAVRPRRADAERLANAVRRQLALSDEQAARLRVSTRQFAMERDRLTREERLLRLDLRAALSVGDSVDQTRVARLLDDLVRTQRRRVDLLASEQRELATFLTPVQRARFLAMQERALRAAQQARAQRAGASPPAEDIP